MKRCFPLFFLIGCATLSWSQTASIAPAATQKPDPDAIAAKDPNKIVATVNGKQLTAKQADDLLKLIPEEQRRTLSNLQSAVQQLYMVTDLAGKAEAQHLEQQAPYRQRIEVDRDGILAQAYVTEMAKKEPAPSDPKQYYDGHPGDFDRATVSGVVIAFNPPGTPASAGGINRTEQDARQKADDVVKKLKGGADFATVARTDSDDPQSSSRGGELGTLSATTPNVPQDLKDAIFNKLQPGQVSEPVRGSNAFYILKVDSRTKETFDQAKPGIEQQLKADHDRAVSQQVAAKYKLENADTSFFGVPPPAPTTGAKIPSLAKPGSTPVAPQPASQK